MDETNETGKSQPSTLPETEIDTEKKPGSRTTYFSGNDSDKLLFAGLVTDGLKRDEIIKQKMLPLGYTPEKVERFTKAYLQAISAFTDQQVEKAQKSASFEAFEKSFKFAKVELSCLLKVAKVAFKDDTLVKKALNLNGDKGRNTADIFFYMDKFYEAIYKDSKIILMLEVYGYNDRKILLCRDAYTASKTAYSDYAWENAGAIESTKIKDAKMAELNEWMYDYYALAKVANIQDLQSQTVV